MTTSSNDPAHPTIAVLGGTGRTGRRVADRLRSRGVDVRVGSRTGALPFYWEKPETWAPLLDGSTAAYIAYGPDLTHPGAVETLGAFAEQAGRSRLRQLVLLSGRGEVEAQRAEEVVRAAGVPTAALRCSVFAQNFSEHFLHESVLDGVFAFPGGNVAEPFLDIEDLADVAAMLLTDDGPWEVTLELTGPRLLTFAEAAKDLSAAIGRPVTYQPVSIAEFVEGASEAGVPRDEAEGLGAVFTQIFDGRNESITDTVERVLGRPAGDFAAYARRTAATGVWSRHDTSETVAS